MTNFFDDYYSKILIGIEQGSKHEMMEIARAIQICSTKGKKVIVAGNGGSAAMASHISVDLTKAASIRAINFNEADLLTCFANDFGYENWVAEALKAYADAGDVVILVSSSGASPNIINGAQAAKELNTHLVTLSGFSSKNPLRRMGHHNLYVDSNAYNTVEMTHHIWLLAIIDYIISGGQE